MENTPQQSENSLQQQIEYYLSDTNLSRDQFFYNKIENSEDGFLDIEFIEKCNKIKKLGVSREQILEAVKTSEIVEANEDGTALRRTGNKALPEFRAQKKLKTAAAPAGVAVNNQTKEAPAVNSRFLNPVILFIRNIENLTRKNGRELEDLIGKKYDIKVPFARIGHSSAEGGQVVLDANATPAEVVQELLTEGFQFNQKLIKFDKGTDRDRDHFFKDHSNHINRILKKKFGKKLARPERDMKRKWQGALSFLGIRYPSLDAFKSRFKGLITKTENGSEIPADGVDLLKELLKYHGKSESKLEGCVGFTVDFHPEFKNTRCFFIVKEGGEKEDFSYHKCIHNLVNKQATAPVIEAPEGDAVAQEEAPVAQEEAPAAQE